MDKKLYQELKKITEEEKEILKGRDEIDRAIYMNQGSMVVDCKKLLASGKLIQLRPHTRFIHFPKHTHNYIEVVYMCSGSTLHIINGEKVELRQGELLFLSKNANQEIYPAGENDIAVNFIILPEFFDQALSMIGQEENLVRDFLVDCLRSKESQMGYLHFRVAEVLPIQNLVENLIWTLQNPQQNKRSMNQITMGLLFLQLINETDKVIAGENQRTQEIVLTVLKYIEEHYKEAELTELSNQMNYDIYWLSRKIKELTGKNFTELVQIKRLNQAKFLLDSTKLSVADIGYAVGYQNLSYFHRIFHQRFELSPRSYRVKREEEKDRLKEEK